MPQFLPIDIDNYRVDYKILQTIKEKGSEKYKVFVTAVPKNILQSYVDVLQGLDLKLWLLTYRQIVLQIF